MIGQLQLNPVGKLWKTLQNTLFKVILSGKGAEAFILQLTGVIERGLLLEVLTLALLAYSDGEQSRLPRL